LWVEFGDRFFELEGGSGKVTKDGRLVERDWMTMRILGLEGYWHSNASTQLCGVLLVVRIGSSGEPRPELVCDCDSHPVI